MLCLYFLTFINHLEIQGEYLQQYKYKKMYLSCRKRKISYIGCISVTEIQNLHNLYTKIVGASHQSMFYNIDFVLQNH